MQGLISVAPLCGVVARMPVNLLERRNYRDELI